MTEDPPRSAGLRPGYDEEDPYEGEDLSDYPDWWRRLIEKFRDHEMRPYRPSRFSDDTITYEFVSDLETRYDVDVQMRVMDPHRQADPDWEFLVDGERVATFPHERSGEGYTVYGIDSDRLESLVADAVSD